MIKLPNNKVYSQITTINHWKNPQKLKIREKFSKCLPDQTNNNMTMKKKKILIRVEIIILSLGLPDKP